MHQDWGEAGAAGDGIMRVDGGMTASDWTLQSLSNLLDATVDRPVVRETTALGVALLAAWQSGLIAGPDDFAGRWRLDRRFTPDMSADERGSRLAGWRDAVRRTLLTP
jgi:glycerol kinase